MNRVRIRCLTESAVMASLSVILSFITIFRMPQGGTVTAGAMLPVVLMALRRGKSWGIVTGVMSGMIQLILMGGAVHPLSILLDYVLAYGAVGLAVGFRSSWFKVALGTVAGGLCRFFAHLISGAVIFAGYAPHGQNPWIYSLVYNVTYMFPETVVTLVEILLLYKFANRLFYTK